MDTADANAVTFADSELYGGIYFYTYMLITLVILIGSYHFAQKERLHHDSYTALEQVEYKIRK